MRTVVVSARGTFLGKRGERLLVKRPPPRPAPAVGSDTSSSEPDVPPVRGKAARDEEEIPLFRVGEILVPARGVSLSTDLIEEVVARGIPISFLRPGGEPYAMLVSPMLTATTKTRRAQLKAMDNQTGLALARGFVAGKLRNQASLLVYFAKAEAKDAPRRKRVVEAAARVRASRRQVLAIEGKNVDYVREHLLGAEGMGARAYWEGVRALVESHCSTFEGRSGRGAVDSVNALLNYGYGILASRSWAALMLAGLDPFAGFLHTDRPGKPSLVLDAMEELRPGVVDRAVLAYVRLGRPIRFEGGRLDEDSRRALAESVLERLESPVVRRGRRVQLGSVLQQQARSIATFVRGEGTYTPLAMTW